MRPTYRVKYWIVNTNTNIDIGEQREGWGLTGLMTKDNAEEIAAWMRETHEKVEVELDEGEAGVWDNCEHPL